MGATSENGVAPVSTESQSFKVDLAVAFNDMVQRCASLLAENSMKTAIISGLEARMRILESLIDPKSLVEVGGSNAVQDCEGHDSLLD